jgi:hypothetical protein
MNPLPSDPSDPLSTGGPITQANAGQVRLPFPLRIAGSRRRGHTLSHAMNRDPRAWAWLVYTAERHGFGLRLCQAILLVERSPARSALHALAR